MPNKRGRPKKVKSVSNSEYKVTFSYPTGNITHEVAVIEDGLIQLDLSKAVKGKCLVRLEHDGKKAERYLYPIFCKRILVNKDYRSIFAKILTTLLK